MYASVTQRKDTKREVFLAGFFILFGVSFLCLAALIHVKVIIMSLDSVELIIEVEKAFDIEISNLQAEKIITVQGFYEYILSNLSNDISKQEVYSTFVQILHEKLGVSLEEIKPDSRIIEDFGID